MPDQIDTRWLVTSRKKRRRSRARCKLSHHSGVDGQKGRKWSEAGGNPNRRTRGRRGWDNILFRCENAIGVFRLSHAWLRFHKMKRFVFKIRYQKCIQTSNVARHYVLSRKIKYFKWYSGEPVQTLQCVRKEAENVTKKTEKNGLSTLILISQKVPLHTDRGNRFVPLPWRQIDINKQHCSYCGFSRMRSRASSICYKEGESISSFAATWLQSYPVV